MTLGVLGFCLLSISGSWAVLLDDGAEHVVADGNWSDEVVELRNGTTLRVESGGVAGAVTSHDSSAVDVLPGGEVSGRLYLRGESRCGISGGMVGDLQVAHGSVAVVDGGTVGRVSARSFAGVWLLGGSFPGEVEVVEANGAGAFLEIDGGMFSGADGVVVGQGGRLVVRGGQFTGGRSLLLAAADGRCTVSGGTFGGAVEMRGGELLVTGGDFSARSVDIGEGVAELAGGIFRAGPAGVLLGDAVPGDAPRLVLRGDGTPGSVAGGMEWDGTLSGSPGPAVLGVEFVGEGGTVEVVADTDLDGAADDGEAGEAGNGAAATSAVRFGFGDYLAFQLEAQPVRVAAAGGVAALHQVRDSLGEVIGLPPSRLPGRRGVLRVDVDLNQPGGEAALALTLPEGGGLAVRELWEFTGAGGWVQRAGGADGTWSWTDTDGDGRISLALALVEGPQVWRRGFFQLVKEGAPPGEVPPEHSLELVEGGGYIVRWPAAGAEGWDLQRGQGLVAWEDVDASEVVEVDGMLVVHGGGAVAPGPPGEFVITAPGQQVATPTPTVRWTPAAGADHYELHVARNLACDNIAFSATVTGTSVTVPPLPNRAYVLCLTAFNAEGETLASNHKLIVDVSTPIGVAEEPHHIVFVTSNSSIPASTGDQFDDVVTSLADSIGLNPTGVEWQAIVSTSTLDARDKVRILGPVYNTNGELVAHDAQQFWEGILETPMNYDETGALVTSNTTAWTGTGGDGRHVGNDCCEDWSTNSFFFTGRTGSVTSTSAGAWQSIGSNSCNVTRRLYGISPLFE